MFTHFRNVQIHHALLSLYSRTMKMKKMIRMLAAGVMVLAAGCGQAGSASSATAQPVETEQAAGTHVVVDAADREVEVPETVEKVVVAFNLEEYIAAAGEGWDDRLAGWSHAYWEGRRQDAFDTWTAAFPQLVDIPDIGYNDGLNIETIINLNPDVIIASSAVNREFFDSREERLKEAGIPVVYANHHKQTLDMAPEMIIAADPEAVIFTASPQTDISDNIVLGYGADEAKAMEALEFYRNREGWAELSAVKNNRMGALYHDLSRHIFDFSGAQFLAMMIQPDLFADLDPVANLKEFYDRFMPVSLDGAWMITLQ